MNPPDYSTKSHLLKDTAIQWTLKAFSELMATELYLILQLRNEVFILEQNCPYQDLDNKDLYCHHLMGWYGDKLVAYTRLVPPGISYAGYTSIGRVVTSPAVRGTGIGKELMTKSIDTCYTLFGVAPVRIGAQLYLKRFYEDFGFAQTGEMYLEDGIEHIEMTKP
jgi:ElaA protein